MGIKLIGSVLILAACLWTGASITREARRTLRLLRSLRAALATMESKLCYDLCPLPRLCREAAADCTGTLRKLFYALAEELDRQLAPDVYSCMYEVVLAMGNLPPPVRDLCLQLGRSLGRFDAAGQLRQLESIRNACDLQIAALGTDQESRLHSCRILWACAGGALVIVLV